MESGRRTLAGRYELIAVVGRGGMSTVYRATDLVLRRTVAVKLLAGALAEDETSVARFAREARAAASLTHPGLVAVYDTGEDQDTRFIVMEYVAGHSLGEILAQQAPLAPARAVKISEQIADALAAAHAAGIIHRDIKPGNVMITHGGVVKVLDFGIARAMDGTTLTHPALMIGTAAYMAPERALGHAASARADIYSLGCLLYAMLTGRAPFDGEAAAVLHQQVNAMPRPPREANRGIAPALDGLVMQMLAKDPAERPESAALVRDLLAKEALTDTSFTQAKSATAPTARLDTSTITRVLGERVGARRRLLAIALLAAVLLGLALISAAGSPSPRQASGPPRRIAASAKLARRHPPASAAATRTVAQAAGAITSLITAQAEAQKLDGPAAQQLNARLASVLGAYAAGNGSHAQHDLLGFSQALPLLAQGGHLSAAALASLQADAAALSSALAKYPPRALRAPAPAAPAPPQHGLPPGHGEIPPGHGGEPPGQARKHEDSQEGNPEGD